MGNRISNSPYLSAGDPEYGGLLDLALSVTGAIARLLNAAAHPQAFSVPAQSMQLLADASQLLVVRSPAF